VADGPTIDGALIERLLEEELAQTRESVGEHRHGTGCYAEAAALFRELVLAGDFRVPDVPRLRARDHDRPAATRIADGPTIDGALMERLREKELAQIREASGSTATAPTATSRPRFCSASWSSPVISE